MGLLQSSSHHFWFLPPALAAGDANKKFLCGQSAVPGRGPFSLLSGCYGNDMITFEVDRSISTVIEVTFGDNIGNAKPKSAQDKTNRVFVASSV